MESNFVQTRTLNLRKSSLITIFSTLFFLITFILIVEITLRSSFVKKYLNVPYLGSTHRQLEIQLARINIFKETEGKIDCLFVGSSMVWLGVNPVVFRDEFKKNTGMELSCFNFGVATMPAGAAGIMTDILVNEYHPEIVIFGTSPRDYSIPFEAEDSNVIVGTTWVRYRSGTFSLEGWLYSNSFFWGHLRNLNRLLHFDETVFTDVGTSDYDRFGFLPKTRPIQEENIQAGIDDANKWLTNYDVLQENVDGLKQIADHSKNGLTVIIFETPVKPDYYDHFSNKEVDYQQYFQTIQNVSMEYDIPFFQLNDINIIPEDGWWNVNHLNLKGANAFSLWLAEQIGMIEGENFTQK